MNTSWLPAAIGAVPVLAMALASQVTAWVKRSLEERRGT